MLKYNIIDYVKDESSMTLSILKCDVCNNTITFYIDLVSPASLELFLSVRKLTPSRVISKHLFKWFGTKKDYQDILKEHDIKPLGEKYRVVSENNLLIEKFMLNFNVIQTKEICAKIYGLI